MGNNNDALTNGAVVGRIFKANAASVGLRWIQKDSGLAQGLAGCAAAG